MNKKLLLGTVAVFLVWVLLDYLIHQVMLVGAYTETASLWRTEMNIGLIYVVTLIAAAAFVYIYAKFVVNKSVGTAIKYALVYGIGAGISFAYGGYAVMDIPYYLALTWFLGTIVEFLVAGYIIGMIMTPDATAYTYTSSRGTTYVLHSRETTLKNGLQRTIFYFGKEEKEGAINAVPAGYMVIETKNGLPVLKKK